MSKLAVLLAAVAFVAVGCGGDNDVEPGAAGAVPFDQAFIDAMVPHHREAIEMAEAAKARGLMEPDVDEVASDIITSQQQEIEQLLEWREEWFGSRALGPILPVVLGVPENELGMGHGGVEEITEADDVDAAFAEMMIPHHQGAIAMADAAKERGEHDEIRELADEIIAAQTREIGIMDDHASGEHG
jgi:uncharacterized protein (DUF305 family)